MNVEEKLMYSEECTEQSVDKKRKPLILLLIILILLFLIGMGIYFYWNRNQGPVIDANATTYAPAVKRPEKLTESQILVPGQDIWYMDEKADEVAVTLGNPEGNKCYFKYSVIEKNTQEQLFETDLIPTGQAVLSIKPSKKMEVGNYPILVKIQTFDLDNPEVEFNNAEVETELIVLKDGVS